MTTGEAITQWRKYRRMSQEALAAATGLTRQTIYAYEANRRSPTVPIMLEIVRALGMVRPSAVKRSTDGEMRAGSRRRSRPDAARCGRGAAVGSAVM